MKVFLSILGSSFLKGHTDSSLPTCLSSLERNLLREVRAVKIRNGRRLQHLQAILLPGEAFHD